MNRAIPVTVAGVDSFRGPYQEEVSTIAVSCHGCRYESKYEVLPEASVLLQLTPKTPDSKPVATRGRVKWTKRPQESGGLFQTAIELEQPGNIWGIEAPPADWLPFSADAAKGKQVTVLRPASNAEAQPAAPGDPKQKPAARPAEGNPAVPSAQPRAAQTGQQVGQLIGGFQQQMERMLSEAADVAVRDRAVVLVGEMRLQLREEAKNALAEASAAQAERWNESARSLHGQWTKRIEGELQQAVARMEMRHRELEELSERLAAKAHDRLETFIEGSRKEAVDKIVARLKEQSAPVIENARKAAADLAKHEQDLETLYQQAIDKSVAQVEETCGRLDRQFEMILRERLDSAREDLERLAGEAAKKAFGGFQKLSQQGQQEAQAQLQQSLGKVAEDALSNLREKAGEISREFGGELSRYSRSHLEFVSGAIGELAKGIGKLSKD